MSNFENLPVIAIGSKNPVKINAAKLGFEKIYRQKLSIADDETVHINCVGIDVPSNVPDQPLGDSQTKSGAITRAKNVFEEYKKNTGCHPSYAVGMEGGVGDEEEMDCFAWIAIFDGKKLGVSRTASFTLPPLMRDLIRNDGLELGDADDKVFGTVNSKQKGGTVGKLTDGVIDRTKYYEQAVILAFIPFQWESLYI